jgi:predicted transcriptional regulator YheO
MAKRPASQTPAPRRRNARRDEEMALLRRLAAGIERLFAPHCEVVVHDFSDLEHSIVHVAGSLSGRTVGGAATDLLLRQLRGGATDEDLHGYHTQLPNGRNLKSSTMFLRDAHGAAYGAFCVNFDISAFVGAQKMLAALIDTRGAGEVSEALTDDINQTIGSIITETIGSMGKAGPFLSRDDKVALIERLDQRGVFQVKKAIPILAEQLGCSKATLYNYLREAREHADQ